MNSTAQKYFEKAILQYNKGDIEKILDARIKCAGPLLHTVLHGIDTMGGICYGFDKGSSVRSVDYMKTYMNISPQLSAFIYSSIRCGLTHEGMPRMGLKFYAHYDRLEKAIIFSSYTGDDYIYLNVVEFAYIYLDSIQNIFHSANILVKFEPKPKSVDLRLFKDAKQEVDKDIDSLLAKIEGRNPPQEGVSYAARKPDNFLDF